MKLHSKMVERLRRNVVFENLTEEQFAGIRPLLTEKRYSAGSVIVTHEGMGECLFLLAEGRVKITRSSPEGEDSMLALLHHGDCFGELELIDGRPRSSEVIAVEDCVTFQLQKDDFLRLMHTCQPFTIRLLQLLSVRLRATNFHFVQEMDRNHRQSLMELGKLQQLIEATKILNSTLNLDTLLTVILETALSIVDGDRGTVYLIDTDKQQLWSKVFKASELVEIRLPIGRGIAGYVAASGETINIADAYLDKRFDPDFDTKTGYRTRTMLCMPMRDKAGKTIGVFQLLNKNNGLFTADDENIINALSIHSSIALENARLYEQERQKIALEKDLKAAHEVQISLLPKIMPVIEGYDIAGTSIAAQMVGGDYFDFITLGSSRVAVCLGDVSGKGLPASLLMANLQATLRGLSLSNPPPAEWVRRANNLLFHNTNSDKFVTLFFGILDTANHTLSYCNAGHDHPFLFNGEVDPKRLKIGGLIVSIMEDFPYSEAAESMEEGGLLLINSDGVTEAMNAEKEQYGEKRLKKVLAANRHKSAREIIDAVLAGIRKHTGSHPQFDDITLVVVKRNGPGMVEGKVTIKRPLRKKKKAV